MYLSILTTTQAHKSKVLYISSSTLKKPLDADVFIKAWGKSAEALRAEITSHYPPTTTTTTAGPGQKVLVVFEAINPLASSPSISSNLALFLSSLITTPAVSLVGVYHTDIPLSLPRPSPAYHNEYEPHPLTTLTHLATAILRVSNLNQAILRRRARDRSLQEPEWGLSEGREGVLIGLTNKAGHRSATGSDDGGLVLEMEMRRRSGRSVAETFVFSTPPPTTTTTTIHHATTSRIYLLSEHPAFRTPAPDEANGHGEGGPVGGAKDGGGDDGMQTTFNLGLTEKQRRDREGIVLPYYDAQTEIGAGEGGRILYEMGREDDFDDEEDEI